MTRKYGIKDYLDDWFYILASNFLWVWLSFCAFWVFIAAFTPRLYIAPAGVLLPKKISILVYILLVLFMVFVFTKIFCLDLQSSAEYVVGALPFVLLVNLRSTKVPVWEILILLFFVIRSISISKKRVYIKKKRCVKRGEDPDNVNVGRIYRRTIGKGISKATCIVFGLIYSSIILSSIGVKLPDRLNVLKQYSVEGGIYDGNTELLRGETYKYDYGTGNQLWADHIDELRVLSDENYKNASLEERIKGLQTLSNLEAAYLGCTDIPVISVSEGKKGSAVVGYYNHNQNVIWISKEIVMQNVSINSISTVLHEIRHCFQRSCVELIDLDSLSKEEASLKLYTDIKRWKYEMENYKGEEAVFCDYTNQYIEMDSRDYEDNWAGWYYCLVNSDDPYEYLDVPQKED